MCRTTSFLFIQDYVPTFDSADARGEGVFPLFISKSDAGWGAVFIFIVAKMGGK